MTTDTKTQKALEMIDEQIQKLLYLVERAQQDKDFHAARDRLRRWKLRTIDLLSERVHPDEGHQLHRKHGTSSISNAPLRNLTDEAAIYHGFLLSLREQLENDAEWVFSRPREVAAVETPQPPVSKAVFVIHGHDEPNRLKLEKLLRTRWHLEPIILSSEPARGRTLIEKFEEEAQRAPYAIALLTPDDSVEGSDTGYTQARPNVIFELGWFYGRLGRDKVCILLKKGTKIHSDLDGINRVEFGDSVDEAVSELETELKEAALL